MQPKISVIIPVYNAEKYLEECLDSVVGQTLKDIEIICINDGSTDGSLKILEEYTERDDRIILLNQENKGAGEARNAGINAAKGRYLAFLDADDVFELNMLEKLYLKAKKDNLDVTICHSVIFDDKTDEIINSEWVINKSCLPDKDIFNVNDIPSKIFGFCNGWAWDKLYEREFIIQNGLKFQNLKSANDMFFVMMSLCLADKISVIDDILIKHRENVPSSVSRMRDDNPFCFIEAIYCLKKELEKRNLYKKVEQGFVNWNVEFCFWHLDTLNYEESREQLAKQLKQEVFPSLGVYNFKKDFFYNKKTYARIHCKNLCNKNYWYQCIFSIKNVKRKDNIYKAITVLGTKFEIRKK